MGASEQHTIKECVDLFGVGLHSGVDARLRLRPAPAGHGVVFKRCDPLNGSSDAPFVEAAPANVVETRLGTTIANERGVTVSTTEHLMAALALCGVDNVLAELTGPEVPILDGSAEKFVEAIGYAGLCAQNAPRRSVHISESVSLEDGPCAIYAAPCDHFRLDIEIDFDDCFIGRQSLTVRIDDEGDRRRLAASRTFCRLRDVEMMRSAGLIRGGSLENSIVVDGDRLLNGEALRDPEEFALHKALDLIGDFYLLGAPLTGHIRAVRPGHDLNTRFARLLAEDAGDVAAPSRAAAQAVAATA
ncbi:MAG: UDP-3-O-acyl-N-acetylglucosamine deacetylase [Pseudomonadota bacterium]